MTRIGYTMHIRCSECHGRELSISFDVVVPNGINEQEVADSMAKKGWLLTRTGMDYCPLCRPNMSEGLTERPS